MGRYFGIVNQTTNQKVSSYWKGTPWCNCHDVMHQLHWASTDSIYSASYCDHREFVYNPETNTMEVVEETFENDTCNNTIPEEHKNVLSGDSQIALRSGEEDATELKKLTDAKYKIWKVEEVDDEVEDVEELEELKELPETNNWASTVAMESRPHLKSYLEMKDKIEEVEEVEEEVVEEVNVTYVKKINSDPNLLGFDSGLDGKFDHVPKWNGNECTCCGYIYDPTKLGIYIKNFDEVFFMN